MANYLRNNWLLALGCITFGVALFFEPAATFSQVRSRFSPTLPPAGATSVAAQSPGSTFATQPSPFNGAPTTPVPSYTTPGVPIGQPGVPATQGLGFDPYSTNPGGSSISAPYYGPSQPGGMMPNQPSALYPQGAPARPNPGYYGYQDQNGSMGQWRRFMTEFRLEHTWIYGPSAISNMQMNITELSGTFALPFLFNPDSPLLVTPGFALNLFDGPQNLVFPMPSKTYDAYLDFGWKPHITPQISADIGFRVSASSDFRTLNTDAFRFMGRGVGILTFSPTMQIAMGVVYLDRQNIKLLPAGGVVWTPNADLRADFLFPNPKIAKRLKDFGTTEVWGYMAGEYGGGSWNMNMPMGNTNVDYNDMRFSVGVEWTTLGSWRGYVEVGYLFRRELYASKAVNYDLGDTFMVRGGLAF